MNDRAVELLEQYDLEVLRARKGRGAFLCDTEDGCYVFMEYQAGEEHAALQKRLLEQIKEAGRVSVEQIIPAKEGNLLVKDRDGVNYILKTRVDGRECAYNDRRECLEAVKTLAVLQKSMVFEPEEGGALPVVKQPYQEYEKHVKELRKIRKYLKQKGKKQDFEVSLGHAMDYYLEEANNTVALWTEYLQKEDAGDKNTAKPVYVHGDYQYHNLLQEGKGWFVANFEKCMVDDPMRDFGFFFRKLMEKTDWSVALGREMLRTYEAERPLTDRERTNLYYRLLFPEKFWKIANFYFNTAKSWIPAKNLEKLERVIRQEKLKQENLPKMF